MRQTQLGVLSSLVLLISLTALVAQPSADYVSFPENFRDWFAVNSMIVTKESPQSAEIGGMHIVYINSIGRPILQQHGPLPYPDGTIFADDVHDFAIAQGVYAEGPKKAVAVMVKNRTKYAATGGWGFQVWAAGDPSKPLVPDTAHAIKACFECHTPQKNQDFTFSTFIP